VSYAEPVKHDWSTWEPRALLGCARRLTGEEVAVLVLSDATSYSRLYALAEKLDEADVEPKEAKWGGHL